jgi:hypothetical protein
MIYCGLLLLADSVDLPLLHVRDVGVAGSNPAIPTNSGPCHQGPTKKAAFAAFFVSSQSANLGFSV